MNPVVERVEYLAALKLTNKYASSVCFLRKAPPCMSGRKPQLDSKLRSPLREAADQ